MFGQRKASVGEAFSSANTSEYAQVGELLVDPTDANGDTPFSANVTRLVNMIYGAAGSASSQIAALKTQLTEASDATEPNAISAADLRAKTYKKSADQSIVVRLGGLDWIVTYVSTDAANENVIAVLWLSNNHQEVWAGRDENLGAYYGLVNGGLYSDWSADWAANTPSSSYPSNMYGTSYIRVETLNNPNNRTYATSDSATTSGTTQSASHIFSLYTCASEGLTQYLTTPSQMSWIINMQNPANCGLGYWLNNESLTTNNAYGYTATNGWYSADYNYTSKTGYSNWGTDYLWLPSMAEIGYNDSYDGLWELSMADRSTYDSSTVSLDASDGQLGLGNSVYGTTAYAYTCSRSARINSSIYGFVLNLSGFDYNRCDVNASMAVRPALLLNLSSASEHAEEPTFGVSITNTSDSGNQYLDSAGDSYGTSYQSSKMNLTVQLYSTAGTLVASQTVSALGDSVISFCSELTFGETYRVHILAPTYLRYTVKHYINKNDDLYNNFSCNTFTVVYDGEQEIEVEVAGLADASWLTFYG